VEAIFQRRQTIDARLPIEDAWEPKRRFLSSYNFDLGIAAVIYGIAIGIAFWVIAASHIGDTIQGSGTELQIIFGTAVFGTFIELLRRTYDTALRRLATIDMFTSEILSIMRVPPTSLVTLFGCMIGPEAQSFPPAMPSPRPAPRAWVSLTSLNPARRVPASTGPFSLQKQICADV
jgi:hypothetical protein